MDYIKSTIQFFRQQRCLQQGCFQQRCLQRGCLQRVLSFFRRPYTKPSFEECCKFGDTGLLRDFKITNEQAQMGLLISIEHNNLVSVTYFVENFKVNLDIALEKLAKKGGLLTIAEFLLKKGADPIIGIKNTKSPHLNKLCQVYRAKREEEGRECGKEGSLP
jgi:hypothetical protein